MGSSEQKLDFATQLDFSAILTNPILDIAARVWDEDRYQAFRVCYRSMRRIDDLVDEPKSAGVRLGASEAAAMSEQMTQWLQSIRSRDPRDNYSRQFIDTLDRYAIPLWPWERLCRAMIYDLTHDGFPTLLAFLRYCEGAAIAPAAIFMHLCGVRAARGQFQAPPFDIRIAARSLAIFSYLTHIMRDFEKDQRNHLHYFADALMADSGISRAELARVAETAVPTPAFRHLMQTYQHVAEYYRVRARRILDTTLPLLEPRYQLSLELIYQLYLQIFERVDTVRADFSEISMQIPPDLLQKRIMATIEHFQPVEKSS